MVSMVYDNKIFFIDRFMEHSVNTYKALYEIISKNNNFSLFFIGSDDNNPKIFSNQGMKNALKVWSQGDFVRKILKHLISDKPEIAHFSFELKTFGSLLQAIKFPLLLFLIRLIKTRILLTLYIVLFYKNGSNWELPSYFESKIPKFLIKILAKIFIKTICILSNRIVVATYEGKSCLIEYYGIDERKVDVIQLGVSTNTVLDNTLQEKYTKLFSKNNIILYYGVISPRKNYETVIKAMSILSEKLPNHILVIVGKAPKEFKNYEQNLQKLTKNLRLENKVFFLGYVPNSEVDELFNLAEMALYVYNPMPDSTTALSSAIQHNIPVIVSDIGIFKEILPDTSALFVSPGNAIELSDAIFKLATNVQLRNKFKDEMISLSQKFTWKQTATKYFNLYQKLLSS